MEANEKICILNAHNGQGWYPKGQQRLIETLRFHGWPWDIMALECRVAENMGRKGWHVKDAQTGKTLVYNFRYDSSCVYTLKAAAWDAAIDAGYNIIFWLDCSVWPVKDPAPFMDIFNQDGYYFWRSGYTIGQTCSDAALAYFNITRKEAHEMMDTSTSMFGVNLGNPNGNKFIERWLKSAANKAFHGSRDPLPTPKDGQLFHHRQDQSAASCIAAKMGLKLHDPGIYSQYANEFGEYPESVYFVMRGM